MILPGSTLGMLGGGQLGRMFANAASLMGYDVIVLEPQPDCPAAQFATEQIVAAYDDEQALETLAKRCDVITTEFENIPADVLRQLSANCTVYPPARAVEIAQDRRAEKAFVQECGLLPVPFGEISTHSDIAGAIEKIVLPAILKTARLGYDGKGQQTVNSAEDVVEAFKSAKQVPCVLEQRVDLDYEISVILGRNANGETDCFPVAENEHRDGILFQTSVPTRAPEAIQQAAQSAAIHMADKLDYVGIMAVEFFVTRQGELLVNEFAPRTHNSGHYTIDACLTSQFEQQVRMICALPFGSTQQLSPVVMTNLLGDLWNCHEISGETIGNSKQPRWNSLFRSPHTKLHLYGKKEARPGRKMGHFCTLAKTVGAARQEADRVFDQLPCRITE